MLTLWQLWQPLLDKTYLGLYLLRICISPLRRRRRNSKFTRSWSDQVRWILWFYFSMKVFCLLRREKQKRFGGKLLVFGCSRSKGCTNTHSLDHTYFVFILRQGSHFYKSCIRGYVEVIYEACRYHIEPLLKGIGGWVCRKRQKSV